MHRKYLFLLLACLLGFGALQAQSSTSARRWAIGKYTRAIIEQKAPEGENAFAGKQAEQTFRQQCKKLSTAIETYNKGKKLCQTDWNSESITQTFATVEEKDQVKIRFRFTYYLVQTGSLLTIDRTAAFTAAQIGEDEKTLEKLQNQLNPPDAVDPGIR